MPFGNGFEVSTELPRLEGDTSAQKELVVVYDENVETIQGVDFTKFVKVEYLSPEDIEKAQVEVRAKERPVDYQYIERMKKEGVTEELAVKAFVGRFYGNEDMTRFFLNSDFYYGSDAPTPMDKLIKAIKEDTIPECIDMLEATKVSFEYGDHF